MKNIAFALGAALMLGGCGDVPYWMESSTTTTTTTYAVTLSPDPIPLGGTTTVTATITADGAPNTTAVMVAFTSSCTAIADTIVATSGGTATLTVTTDTCIDGDTVTAAVSADGGATVAATATVTIGGAIATPVYALTLSPATIDLADASTVVEAAITVDGAPYTAAAVSVTFTSTCATATITTSPANTDPATGIASVTFTPDATCTTANTLTASATVETVSVSDEATFTDSSAVAILMVPAGTLSFVTVDPAIIGVAGAPLPASSTVTFQLSGAPAGQAVTFALDDPAAATLSATSGVTDADGRVSTSVSGAAVPGTVRVIATVDSTGVSAQSAPVTVTTGTAYQDRFALTASAPAVAVDQTVTLTARALDYLGLPVPDGTMVSFSAEGGQLGAASCTTRDGRCSVDWIAALPLPADGRVTVLATVAGEESFIDANGNNRYDDGEVLGDLAEAWRDDNDNGTYDLDLGEYFIDLDGNGTHEAGDSLYAGLLCAGPSQCATSRSVHARSAIVLPVSLP